MKEKNKDLDTVKRELKSIREKQEDLKYKEYLLNDDYLALLQEKCRKEIGRCFKKLIHGEVVSYLRVVDIDKVIGSAYALKSFNEYLYPCICFDYPYIDSKIPFYELHMSKDTCFPVFLDSSKKFPFKLFQKGKANPIFLRFGLTKPILIILTLQG